MKRNKSLNSLERQYNGIGITNGLLTRDELDLGKGRNTNLFQYNGQFSPDLIGGLIDKYANKDSVILDPFMGCGTTLFESAKRGHSAIGIEINPSGIIMSEMVLFHNLDEVQRNLKIKEAKYNAEAIVFNSDEDFDKSFLITIGKIDDPYIKNFLINSAIRLKKGKIKTKEKFDSIIEYFSKRILDFPYSKKCFDILHSDIRDAKIKEKIDLIITSPPYINVFNYHQQNRSIIEDLGFDVLDIAKSEFGSNRKNRQNRFLTVIQYILDIGGALKKLRKDLKNSGRMIIVIGRESNVLKTPFRNDLIVGILGMMSGYKLLLHQERKFKNRFGKVIYEDILHFIIDRNTPPCDEESYRRLSKYILEKALKKAKTETIKKEIIHAINKIEDTNQSPILKNGNTSP